MLTKRLVRLAQLYEPDDLCNRLGLTSIEIVEMFSHEAYQYLDESNEEAADDRIGEDFNSVYEDR